MYKSRGIQPPVLQYSRHAGARETEQHESIDTFARDVK